MKITVTEKFDKQGPVVERTTVYGEDSEFPSHEHWWFSPKPLPYPFSGRRVFMSQTPDGKVRIVEDRAKSLERWIRENAPARMSEQKHLDEGSQERNYWNYGYLVALRDVLRMQTPPCGEVFLWQTPVEES